jgi:hypothetical protein
MIFRSLFGVILGALIGGVLGFAGPWGMAVLWVTCGGDPRAAGAFSFFPIITIPAGLVAGAVVGPVLMQTRQKALRQKDERHPRDRLRLDGLTAKKHGSGKED